MSSLVENGWCVVPFLEEDRLKELNGKWRGMGEHWIEYKNSMPFWEKSLTQHPYINCVNPSSFHDPLVRSLRREVKRHMMPYFKEYNKEKNVEMLFDQVCLGVNTDLPSKSKVKWVYGINDTHKRITNGDEFFSGWVNLNTTTVDQFFYFPIAKTKAQPAYKITVRQTRELDQMYKDLKLKPVSIPPGHILIYKEEFLTYPPDPMERMYVSFRLTRIPTGTWYTIDGLDGYIREFKVPKVRRINGYPRLSDGSYFNRSDWAVRSLNSNHMELKEAKNGVEYYSAIRDMDTNTMTSRGVDLEPYDEEDIKVLLVERHL